MAAVAWEQTGSKCCCGPKSAKNIRRKQLAQRREGADGLGRRQLGLTAHVALFVQVHSIKKIGDLNDTAAQDYISKSRKKQ